MTSPADLLDAFREFADRVDALDPSAPLWGDVEVRAGDRELRLALRGPVVQALISALRDYHDPRYLGSCDYCGGPRLDENFLCRDCGRPNGVFGQMLAERAARHHEPPAIADS